MADWMDSVEEGSEPSLLGYRSREWPVKRCFEVAGERRLAAAGLAVRWFAGEHEGKLPKSLEELVPKYLPWLPKDPMASDRSIRYVADEKRPVVYSVGYDGMDDGGSDWPMNSNPRSHIERWGREDAV